MEAFWRDLISHGAGLLTNSNLIGWLKGWAVIPSLFVLKGYNKHKNGFPKMTLSVMFLTRTNFVIKGSKLQLLEIRRLGSDTKREVSYNCWKSGDWDWALKPGNAEGK